MDSLPSEPSGKSYCIFTEIWCSILIWTVISQLTSQPISWDLGHGSYICKITQLDSLSLPLHLERGLHADCSSFLFPLPISCFPWPVLAQVTPQTLRSPIFFLFSPLFYCSTCYTAKLPMQCLTFSLSTRCSQDSAKPLQLCPTVCEPMDHSLPGSSVHGIFQARVLEWGAILSSRGSCWSRDRMQNLN